ncbi:MarR family winged helix-turn-helix transcriptional regulator [Pseudomonas sp. FME51]|uniref:MarR family winged helix-turn-helix transcriptional regulator n=1 Tax=Pseudomonas sp. FME51 TaxID=2742609 RepID=UPI001867E0B7|nr:MarR family transcriptional regulator [Pseudomonas sp. FME51]
MKHRFLADPLQQLTHAYRSHMRRAIQASGVELPVTHVRAIKGVALIPKCTAQLLAVRMQRDKAQITRVLNELLGAGLIVKRGNPEDGRSQLLELSAEGQALMLHVAELESATAERMTRGLSEEQIDTFIRTANQITDNLND